MGTPGQRILSDVEEEVVVTVGASHPPHGGVRRHRPRPAPTAAAPLTPASVAGRGPAGLALCPLRARGGRRRPQADDPLAVWPGAGDPLTGVFAYEEAVARAADVLAAGRGVADGRGLVAVGALDHVLVALAGDVDLFLFRKKTQMR